MASPVTFAVFSMGWNAEDVKPFAFNNTLHVTKGSPLKGLVDWTAVVARGAPGGRLQALVINCHAELGYNYDGTLDSAGGIPHVSAGFKLAIGDGIVPENVQAFSGLSGLVGEIHIYACSAASTAIRHGETDPTNLCQRIADTSRATVVAALAYQPDVIGPGPNMAPAMVGRVVRFKP